MLILIRAARSPRILNKTLVTVLTQVRICQGEIMALMLNILQGENRGVQVRGDCMIAAELNGSAIMTTPLHFQGQGHPTGGAITKRGVTAETTTVAGGMSGVNQVEDPTIWIEGINTDHVVMMTGEAHQWC